MKTHIEYYELLSMYKLALEAGQETQRAYNLMIMNGAQVPAHVRMSLDIMMASTQKKVKKINEFNNKMGLL